MKATTIFGGVQVFQIIIGIIRSKFIAVLLGPAGMGIAGLLQSTTGLIANLTNFGLSTSAVKDISAATSEKSENKINKIVTVFRKLIWITGFLGCIITLLLSPILSYVAFGNDAYALSFAILSVTLLIDQLSTGDSVLLRALRQVRLLAKASVLGSILGLITTVPLYYMYGEKGIVPALVIASLSSFFINKYFSRKIKIKKQKVGLKTIKQIGKGMLTMGFLVSLNGIILQFFSFLVRIFISKFGSVDDVGLYNAGFAIVNSYVNMVFAAMATDYFPRLSSVVEDLEKANKTINQQAEVAILILSPIIMIFIVFIKWVILVLYSEAFLPINKMILFASVGMLFKSLSWAIAFIFLAKGASKFFFWNEFISNTYSLMFNIVGYYWYGLTGLGISFLITYAAYAAQVTLVSTKLFGFRISKDLLKVFFLNIILIVLCTLNTLAIKSNYIMYSIGLVLIVCSIIYNFKILNKKLGLVTL